MIFALTGQNLLIARSEGKRAGLSIQRLQKHESEKLVLVAALHMDKIRERFPAFTPHLSGGGLTLDAQSHKEYIAEKKRACEDRVREEMENVISEKCDLIMDN